MDKMKTLSRVAWVLQALLCICRCTCSRSLEGRPSLALVRTARRQCMAREMARVSRKEESARRLKRYSAGKHPWTSRNYFYNYIIDLFMHLFIQPLDFLI